LNSKLKSIAFALKARDIELFTDSEQPNCFLIYRPVCSDCNTYFHTSLLECFFCGEINYYLLTCDACGDLSSITGNKKRKCNACNAPNGSKKYRCKNPDCFSNGNFSNTLNQITDFKGVFERTSQWNLSCVHCVNCGSAKHEYKGFRVFLYDEKNFDNSKYQTYKNENCEKGDLIILKLDKNNQIEYDYEIIDNETNRQVNFDKIGKKDLEKIVEEILNLPTIFN